MLPAADLFPFLLPVVALILGALVCLVAEPLLDDSSKHQVLPWISIGSIVLAGLGLYRTVPGHLHGMFAIDAIRAGLAMVLLVVAALAIAAMQQTLSRDRFKGGEPYAMILLASIGVLGMVFSTNTIALFVCMELASFSIYPMIGLRRQSVDSSEALLKYFVMGAVFSALFLYGASLAYGATGTTAFAGRIQPGRDPVYFLGFALMSIGLLFKTSTAPFHFWSPDAYTGAPVPVTGFMAAAVKIGAFTALGAVWLNYLASQAGVAPMAPITLSVYVPPEVLSWLPPELRARIDTIGKVFGALGLLSILVGSLSLLGQRSIRRLMAFSGVVNAGFLLLCLLLPSLVQGHIQLGVLWFYLAVYALSAMGLLACLSVFTGEGDEGDHLSTLAGAARRHPLIGAALTIFLVSLAGLPPAAGFIAKFQVLTGLMLSAATPSLIWIPAGAMILALVAAAGYLRVLVLLWSNPGPGSDAVESPKVLLATLTTVVALLVLALSLGPTLLFGK